MDIQKAVRGRTSQTDPGKSFHKAYGGGVGAERVHGSDVAAWASLS
ncbi:MAG: hypothetical protein LUD48_00525 [Prevotella sp.]|nr:hypothetical protein [Prevotella sp.]